MSNVHVDIFMVAHMKNDHFGDVIIVRNKDKTITHTYWKEDNPHVIGLLKLLKGREHAFFVAQLEWLDPDNIDDDPELVGFEEVKGWDLQ